MPTNCWKLRSDLSIVRRDDGWLLSDDLSGQFLLLPSAEFTVVSLLDGTRTTEDILLRLQESETRSDWTERDIHDFLRQLRFLGLVVPVAATTQTGIQQFPTAKSQPASVTSIAKKLIQSLFQVRVPLINPTPILDMFAPLIDLLLSRAGRMIITVTAVAGVCIVLSRFDEFAQEFQTVDQWLNAEILPWLMVCFIATRWVHEFGHAIAAYRCGVRTREMGVQFYLLIPLLYTDVTDSWNVSRSNRLRIGIAGMAAEFFVAGMAAILWSLSNPGLTRLCLANITLFCSLGTLAFNGNPFLRYDGYYLLSDLVGVPNLMQRSSQALRASLLQFIRRGEKVALQPVQAALALYGVISILCRIVIVVSIGVMIMTAFSSWGFTTVGRLTAVLLTATQLGIPLGTTMIPLIAEVSQTRHRTDMILRLTMGLVIVFAAMLAPLPRSIVAVGSVECSGKPLFTTLNGTLRTFAPYGTLLTPESVVCEVSNAEVEQERLRLNGRKDELRILVNSMRARGVQGPDSGYAEALDRLVAAENRLLEFERESGRTVVQSDRTGFLMPPRGVVKANRGDELTTWDGVPLIDRNQGAHLEAGTLLGFVSAPADFYVECWLTEAEATLVSAGQSVDLRFPAGNGLETKGVVIEVLSPDLAEDSESPSDHSSPLQPRSLPTRNSAGDPDHIGLRSQREISRNWTVVIGINSSDQRSSDKGIAEPGNGLAKTEQLLAPAAVSQFLYSQVEVRIHTEPASVVTRLMRYLTATFG